MIIACWICGNENSPKQHDGIFWTCKSRRKCLRRHKRLLNQQYVSAEAYIAYNCVR